MSLVGLFLLICVGGTVLSVGGMLVVRRFVPLHVHEEHKEVAGFIYAVVGAIYAVLVAFTVIFVWEDHRDAEMVADREASSLSDLAEFSRYFPEDRGAPLRKALAEYCRAVIERSWPLMSRGAENSTSSAPLTDIWERVRALDPSDETERVVFRKVIDEMSELADRRRDRALAVKQGVPGALWLCLVIGATVTIGFSYFFGLRNPGVQVGMTTGLALMILINLFLIAAFEHPFSGGLGVTPEAFEKVLPALR